MSMQIRPFCIWVTDTVMTKPLSYSKNILNSIAQGYEHRVHRVANAAFWRTFHNEGKISPGW